MSCITEILKRKSDREYWAWEGNSVEDGGTYKGYEYLVTLTPTAHRCGYIAIPNGHPLYGLALDSTDYNSNLSVHGGITFSQKGDHIIGSTLGAHSCDDMWIGFDAAHAGDASDFESAERAFKNFPSTIKALKLIKDIRDTYPHQPGIEVIRTKEYIIAQCKQLIDQVIAIEGTSYAKQ